MDAASKPQEGTDIQSRMNEAIRLTAPGTALRRAIDMIVDGHLGALICIGDTNAVIAAGESGFKLDVSFTSNRLFELSKMDGAIVLDRDLTQILRANFHLNPDPTLPTSETGTRHRTAARMSLLTDAVVISVSERRSVVNVYVGGRSTELRKVSDVMATVNQLTAAMSSTRQQLDRSLLRLTTLELDNLVTLGDITEIFYLFEVLMSAGTQLDACILELGTQGRVAEMQREEFIGDVDEAYTLMIRDYAADSSEENAQAIRETFRNTANKQLRSATNVAHILGYEDKKEDSIMTPLGLRTLSRVSVVREGMADKLVDEYGSLQGLMEAVDENPTQVGEIVNNPAVLANSLHRMWNKGE